jgi:hypothetical protein
MAIIMVGCPEYWLISAFVRLCLCGGSCTYEHAIFQRWQQLTEVMTVLLVVSVQLLNDCDTMSDMHLSLKLAIGSCPPADGGQQPLHALRSVSAQLQRAFETVVGVSML